MNEQNTLKLVEQEERASVSMWEVHTCNGKPAPDCAACWAAAYEPLEAYRAELARLTAQVTELQSANTREVERRREAEAKVDDVLQSVIAEIARAVAKFPTWPTDPLHAVAVLGEEYGELQKAILQHVYEPHKSTAADVREEAIQTAAMAIRFARSLDRYDYARCEQHSQGGAE
jgi:hypothetical protein